MAFLISACSNGVTGSNSGNELSEPYRLALDELISTDTALNENMEYISLDYNQELPLSNSDMKIIEDYLHSKYNVKIYNLTYEQLVEEGLHDQTETTLKGILLKIEKQEQSESKNDIAIEVSKYRSNEGAISAKITLAYEKDQWRIVAHTPIRES